MEKSESIIEIAKALCGFQAEVTDPKLDGTNPHFSSKFSTLSETIKTVRPTLTKHGISFTQPVQTENGQVGVSTMLFHTSGEFIHSDVIWIPLPKSNAQGVGAAITYGRRFSLGATLGLANEEDDDGNSISTNKNSDKSGSNTRQSQQKGNNTQQQNNTPKPISEGQKKAIGAKLNELVKLYDDPTITKDSFIESLQQPERNIGVFGSVSGMTMTQASKSIAQIDNWIKKKQGEQQ